MKIDVLKGAFFLSSLLTYNAIIAADNLDSRVSNLENKMNNVHTKTVYGNYGASCASARPQNEGVGFFLTADLLLWKAYEGGAFIDGSVTNISNTTFNSSETKTIYQDISVGFHTVHFDWDYGYRVGFGYKIPHDNWNIFTNFTHFITHGTESSPQSVPTLFLNNANTGSTFNTTSNSASTTSEIRWDLHYYDVTLELGKAFFISKYCSLDPHFGIRSSWMRQKMHSLLILPAINPEVSEVTPTNTITNVTTTDSSGKNNFWGIGPTIGVDGNWYITRRVSVFGAIAGAVLYGEYHVNFKQHEVDAAVPSPSSTTVNLTIRSEPRRFAPMVQAGLGFEYAGLFNENRMNFSLRVGYELQYWWRQNFLNNNDFISPDDLGMHGLTVQARFDF